MIRIDRLDLIRWGSFTGGSLIFGEEDGLLQLVYGDNEAGKSTTRRAISAMLLGIPLRTQDAHTHAYADLRLGASLQTDQGSVEIIRRKGSANTLLNVDEEPLSDDPLAAALHGLTPQVYGGLFEISHQSLVDGGRQLLEGRGSVGEALFAAAAGTGRLHRLLTTLDSEAANIFKPSGRTTPLNAALAEYSTAVKQLNAATVRPSHAAELRRAVEQAERSVEQLDQRIAIREHESGRLRRWKSIRPTLARHRQLQSELESLEDPPTLDPDAAARRIAAQRERDEGDRELQATTGRISEIRTRLEAIPDPGPALTLADAIAGAHSEIAAIRKAAFDRPKREGELHAATARIEEILPRIDSELTIDKLDRFAADQSTRRDLVRCLGSRGEIFERLRNAGETLSKATIELDNARRSFDASESPVDTTLLQAALSVALKLGPIEQLAADHDREASTDRAAALDRLQQIECRVGSLEALEQLTPPATEAVDALLAVADDLAAQRKALDQDRKRIEDTRAQVLARRVGIEAHGTAPSAEMLTAARERRAAEWERVREGLSKPIPDADSRADRFEHALEESDRIADARTSQADKLAQLAELESAEAKLAAEDDTLAGRTKQLDEHRRDAENSWRELWEQAGIKTPKRASARAWLEHANTARGLLQSAGSARLNFEAAHQHISQHRSGLTQRLTDAKITVSTDATLEELVAVTESALKELHASQAAHAKAKADVERTEQAVSRAREFHNTAEQETTSWNAQWTQLRGAYGLSTDINPDDANEVLQDIDAALAAHHSIAELRRRIDGIDRDRQAFADEVARIAAIASPDLIGLDPEPTATKLMEALTDAQRTREAIETLLERLKDEEQTAQSARCRRNAGACEIESLMAAAGVSEESLLADVERRASRSTELKDELPRLELEIAQVGEDTFQTLAQQSAQITPDQLDADISEEDRELADLRLERDTTKRSLFEANEQFNEVDTSDLAGHQAAKVQQELARARQLAERYAVAKLSARILRDTIECYRATHQGPMMARANDLFPLLTNDGFTGLFIDWNDAGEPLIVGRGADGRSLTVEEMSDGTREQLFLALRIAAIERYVASNGPIPVLFDDVFLESDDTRAKQIFLALADLALHTQVIVFTHHRHLMRIAQNAVHPDRLRVHDLSASALEARTDNQLHLGSQRLAA